MSSEHPVVNMGLLGLFSSGVGCTIGGFNGVRHGIKMRRITMDTNTINSAEMNLFRRYTLSSAFRSQGRLALLHILAGPAIMFARHKVNNLAMMCSGDTTRFDFVESMFCDLLLVPVGCTAMAYSLGYFMAISTVLRYSIAFEALRRIF